MVSPEHSQYQPSPMSKHGGARTRPADGLLYLGGAFMAILLVCSFFSFYNPNLNLNLRTNDDDHLNCASSSLRANLRHDPPEPTFYDDPDLSYSIDKPIKDWDEKRRRWLDLHPTFAGAGTRVVMVTGSQPSPCKNPIGDHFLLRFFKNKVDYCRIHGYDIFYSSALINPKMGSFWAKLPAVKAAMLAHPEAEWIWWVDSDAMFTDMDFTLPFHRYRNHNMVVHGWPKLIYEKKSWTALNAGVFLIRNCQWSMDFMHTWAQMGPIGKDYEKWGEIQRSIFTDKLFPESDDQTALIYLLYKHRELYYDKIYLEGEFYFEGYWDEIVTGFDNVTDRYLEMERDDATLRRRHAEEVTERYAAFREERFLKGMRGGKGSLRRPFVTHFTGCQPCSGEHNKMYKGDTCWNGMIRALNFADNQVMRNYGFVHSHPLKNSPLEPVPFGFPDPGPW